MRRSLPAAITFVFLSASALFSQPYGNEWIQYDQTYYKFPVQADGVYRIDYNTLISAGVPLSSIDARNLQIFARGEEVPLYIEGESDGSFDSGDFIEFYARGNDGYFDADLYSDPSLQAHPAYSLFNDTIFYFLTWNNSTSNARFILDYDTNYASYSPLAYIWRRSLASFNYQYYEGRTFSGGATESAYHETEGWFDFYLSMGSSRSRTVNTARLYTAGPPATIRWKLTGQSDYAPLTNDHHLQVQIAGTSFDTIYEGYKVIQKEFQVPASSLNSFNTTIVCNSINDLGSGADRSALVFAEILYPHQLHFNNKTEYSFIVPDNGGQSKSRLDFTGLNFSGTVWIYDLTNGRRQSVRTVSSNHQALVSNGSGDKDCFVFSEGNVPSISQLKSVNGNGHFTDFSSLSAPNTFLIITQTKLLTSAGQYAAYRNSGGASSLVARVDELYLQFAHGIPKHPKAIRNYVRYLVDTWPEEPAYLFLLGKSLKAQLYRRDATQYNVDLVPSFGNPSSDVLLTAGYRQGPYEPLLPTGRLSANNDQEVLDYLDKVMEYEGASPSPWMKNVLHFAGGKNSAESDRFSSYLELFENVLTDTSFGANVLTFKKSTSAPYQVSLADSIRKLIDGGTSLMTFFGHASTTGGFDQNVDDPVFYQNKGKYPLIVGNSCFTGDIHESGGNSTSEQFVLIADKGAIAFLASVDLGFEAYLRDYSLAFFRSLGQVNYGKALGQHTLYAIREMEKKGQNFGYESVSYLMTLHADPALVINSFPLADYAISNSDVSTDPSPLTTKTDSFDLVLQVHNFGKAVGDSLRIEVLRTFPDLSSELTTVNVSPVHFSKQVAFTLPIYQDKEGGFNRFDISLDPLNLVPELREDNNSVTANLFIKSGDIIPVMPYEFALVPDQSPTLKASTGYAFEVEQSYDFQLDTNASFRFPLETTSMSGRGGVYEWTPNSLSGMPEGQVYFWRTRNSKGGAQSVWRTSSFRFKDSRKGWSQAHFDQMRSNELRFMKADTVNKRLAFLPSVKRLTCQTASTLDYSLLGNILYKIDAELIEYGGCGLGPAIHIAVLDSLSFEPWGTPYQGLNSNHFFGQVNFNGNCGKPRVQHFFIFQANNASQLAGLKDMLLNQVPDGNYVLAWTWVRNDFSVWDGIDPSMRSVFTSLGAGSIASISNDTIPYIFFVKKGKMATANEVLGSGPDEFIYLNENLSNYSSYGNVLPKKVGPSSHWDSLYWRTFSPDNATADSMSLSLSGLDKSLNGASTFIELDRSQASAPLDGLDPVTYPYAELDAYIEDHTFQTAGQIPEWTVYYEGVTELALDARQVFNFHADTLMEGDNLKLSYSIRNISDYASDSILVSYYVIDRQSKRVDLKTERLHALQPDSSLVAGLEYNTRGLTGNNTLVVEVNPGFDQPEQHFFNNTGQIPFYVKSDKVGPILDVTFDGVHILNGDIVSSKPEIAMELSDENAFLILDDTSDFQVYLSDVSKTEHRLYFQSTSSLYNMEFIPASAGRNKAGVTLRPKLSVDGTYKLRVVATDRSKNEAGDMHYEISFEVVNRSTITQLMNYPNPFSTSTRFVFVLTGSRVPDRMQIQIMTVSGKLVKTIDKQELGPIHIGRNVTDYAWDGTDDFGDKLANGVYLYRVTTRLGGSEIEHRSTSADKYFKKGFGKMVILR